MLDRYVETVIEEARMRRYMMARDGEVRTIYLGGGTPTVLRPELVSRLVNGLLDVFGCSNRYLDEVGEPRGLEISIEVRPGTYEYEDLRAIREARVNRLSVGVQSFSEGLLRRIERGHGVEESLKTIQFAFAAGFENVGIDLIFGLPTETTEIWESDLRMAISLDPTHISIYQLELEDGTPLHAGFRNGLVELPGEEESREMYELARNCLRERGFRRYEVSNFAVPRFECLHNLNYWHNGQYLGLGAGAHSHLGGRRFWNEASYREYVHRVSRGELPTAGEEAFDVRREMTDTLIMGLRLEDGISLSGFKERFGREVDEVYPGVIERLTSVGLLVHDGDTIRLSEEGMLLGNLAWSEFT